MKWRMQAACFDADPDMFFPHDGQNIRDARAICSRCPVQEQCLEYALRNSIEFGVWGGLSVRERERMSARMR
jgi:WhiB family redox-sensing transcriptional regulator